MGRQTMGTGTRATHAGARAVHAGGVGSVIERDESRTPVYNNAAHYETGNLVIVTPSPLPKRANTILW